VPRGARPRGAGRGARLRRGVGGRAPLRGLLAVSGQPGGARPPGRAHLDDQAGHGRGDRAVEQPAAGGGEGADGRRHLRRAAAARARARAVPQGVRAVPDHPRRDPGPLRRGRPDDLRGGGDRCHRGRRSLLPAAPRRAAAAPEPLLPRPPLHGGGLAGLDRDGGEAAGRDDVVHRASRGGPDARLHPLPRAVPGRARRDAAADQPGRQRVLPRGPRGGARAALGVRRPVLQVQRRALRDGRGALRRGEGPRAVRGQRRLLPRDRAREGRERLRGHRAVGRPGADPRADRAHPRRARRLRAVAVARVRRDALRPGQGEPRAVRPRGAAQGPQPLMAVPVPRTTTEWDRVREAKHDVRSRDPLSVDPADYPGLRPEVVASWRRSMLAGVDPAAREYVLDEAFRPGTRLAAVAQPIMDRLGDEIADLSSWGFLADRACRLLTVAVGDFPDALRLHRQNLRAGMTFAEDVMGTNGMGCAHETQRAFIVSGTEHYRTDTEIHTTTGVLIRDPFTKRFAGIFGAHCLREYGSAALLPLVVEIGRSIETQLLISRTDGE